MAETRAIAFEDFPAVLEFKQPTLEESDIDGFKYSYDRFYIYWTGWKGFPDAETMCGQWIAIDPEIDGAPRLHSSIPGACGIHYPGAVFNTCTFGRLGPTLAGDYFCPFEWSQMPITKVTSRETKRLEKARGLKRLIEFIDREYINADI